MSSNNYSSKEPSRWVTCFQGSKQGFSMGAFAGGGVGFVSTVFMGLSPQMAGQRFHHFTRQVPLATIGGGMAFGGFFFVGSYLRCV